MANWYYDDSGREVGPLSPAEMKHHAAVGTLSPSTRIRRENGDWTTADRVPGLLGQPPVATRSRDADTTGGVIPYKNVPALIAYYLAVFSLIPVLGLPLGFAAVVLGFLGLAKRRANPAVRGTAHAWIGIVLGGLMTLIWSGLLVLGVFGAVMS